MRKLVERYCFIYGCVASVGALVWYLAALAGRVGLPESVWVVESIVVVFAITMVLTFQRRPLRDPWVPVLRITLERIRIAKVFLAVVAANFGVCTLVAFAWGNRVGAERALSMVLTSLVLLYSIYIAIHWAFRPQNLFPSGFLTFISNPLLYPFIRSRRRPRRLPRSDRGGR